MSEPTNETVVPEATGNEISGDVGWDAAIAEATPAAAPEPVVADPVPELETTPSPEPENTDYTYAKLDNGEHEIRLSPANGGEVFRGKTELEVAQKMAASKAEANRYIQQLKAAPAPTQTNQANSAPLQINPTSLAIADLLAPAFGAKDGQDLIRSYQDMQKGRQEFQQTTAEMQANVTAQQFFSSTPDFVATKANNERLGESFDKTGLPFTQENLRMVHYSLKGQGLYEPAPNSGPALVPSRAANGQFTQSMPLPPTGNSPSPSIGAPSPTLSDLEKMTPEQLEQVMNGAAARNNS